MSVMEIFGWLLAAVGLAGLVFWAAFREHDERKALRAAAPVQVDVTPTTDPDFAEPIVLTGMESAEQLQDTCLDCGKPAARRLPYAMSSTSRPIEVAYCEEHAEFAMTDEAEWWA